MRKLDEFKKQITYCTYCPKLCRFACPVTNAEARETVTPTYKMNLLEMLRGGAIEFDEDTAAVFYRCAGCLACRAYCKHRIDVPEVMERARELAVNRGVQPECLNRHLDTFSETRNPYGPALRDKAAALDIEKYTNRKAPILYFIGCTTIFHYPEIVSATIKILEAAGLEFAVHADPGTLCCGTPALFSGAGSDFRKNASALAAVFKNYKTVLSGCPSCCSSFATKYHAHGIRMSSEITHTATLAAELIRTGRIKPSRGLPARAMYHDPCHLAKTFGIHEEPREILRALLAGDGGELVEFSWQRDKNYCCGGGGLLPVTAPKTSRDITSHRLREFHEAAPDMLVSACPTCERTLRRSAPGANVQDLAVLLAERL